MVTVPDEVPSIVGIELGTFDGDDDGAGDDVGGNDGIDDGAALGTRDVDGNEDGETTCTMLPPPFDAIMDVSVSFLFPFPLSFPL